MNLDEDDEQIIMAFLRDAARRRDGADVVHGLRRLVRRCPDDWTEILLRARGPWGDDGGFVMSHVVIRDGNVVTFERRARGSA